MPLRLESIYLRKTSEKSIEVNVLHALVVCLEQKTRKPITVIAPTQEADLGYDDVLQSLPQGRMVAIQFKPPKIKSPRTVRFSINTSQLTTLRNNFGTMSAFYIFAPFPTHKEIVCRRSLILRDSFYVDIHHMPIVESRNSYSVIQPKGQGWLRFPNGFFIANNLEWLCQNIASGNFGNKTLPPFGYDDYEGYGLPKKKKKRPKKLYYIHIPVSQ